MLLMLQSMSFDYEVASLLQVSGEEGKGLILLEVFDSVEPPIHREDAIDYAEAG